MKIEELIEKYAYLNHDCFRRVDTSEVLKDLKRLDESQPIKLKDVIERIEKFDLGTKAVWINEILYKLGSEYGLHKYYTGYKQGKAEGAMEREKVTVPKFVADWLKYCKNTGVTLVRALLVEEIDLYNYANQKDSEKLKAFLRVKENQELFARAWIDGYEVEKEKRYRVKMKGMNKSSTILKLDKILDSWYFGEDAEYSYMKDAHTRKELEEAGFGDVFNSPLFEIEEVE